MKAQPEQPDLPSHDFGAKIRPVWTEKTAYCVKHLTKILIQGCHIGAHGTLIHIHWPGTRTIGMGSGSNLDAIHPGEGLQPRSLANATDGVSSLPPIPAIEMGRYARKSALSRIFALWHLPR